MAVRLDPWQNIVGVGWPGDLFIEFEFTVTKGTAGAESLGIHINAPSDESLPPFQGQGAFNNNVLLVAGSDTQANDDTRYNTDLGPTDWAAVIPHPGVYASVFNAWQYYDTAAGALLAWKQNNSGQTSNTYHAAVNVGWMRREWGVSIPLTGKIYIMTGVNPSTSPTRTITPTIRFYRKDPQWQRSGETSLTTVLTRSEAPALEATGANISVAHWGGGARSAPVLQWSVSGAAVSISAA